MQIAVDKVVHSDKVL